MTYFASTFAEFIVACNAASGGPTQICVTAPILMGQYNISIVCPGHLEITANGGSLVFPQPDGNTEEWWTTDEATPRNGITIEAPSVKFECPISDWNWRGSAVVFKGCNEIRCKLHVNDSAMLVRGIRPHGEDPVVLEDVWYSNCFNCVGVGRLFVEDGYLASCGGSINHWSSVFAGDCDALEVQGFAADNCWELFSQLAVGSAYVGALVVRDPVSAPDENGYRLAHLPAGFGVGSTGAPVFVSGLDLEGRYRVVYDLPSEMILNQNNCHIDYNDLCDVELLADGFATLGVADYGTWDEWRYANEWADAHTTPPCNNRK